MELDASAKLGNIRFLQGCCATFFVVNDSKLTQSHTQNHGLVRRPTEEDIQFSSVNCYDSPRWLVRVWMNIYL